MASEREHKNIVTSSQPDWEVDKNQKTEHTVGRIRTTFVSFYQKTKQTDRSGFIEYLLFNISNPYKNKFQSPKLICEKLVDPTFCKLLKNNCIPADKLKKYIHQVKIGKTKKNLLIPTFCK